MRAQILAAVFLLGAFAASAQDTSTPQLSQLKDPRAILAAAAPFYDFNDPALKPWHLKATYQLYDDKGNPPEQGTFEYWWASPKLHRAAWTRPGASHTTWYLANGKEAYLTSGEDLDYFERQLSTVLFSPISPSNNADPSKTVLLRNTLKVGDTELVCISRQFGKTLENQPIDFRSLPTQCFDSPLPVLRLGLDGDGVMTTAYDNIVGFQGKFLAHSIEFRAGQQRLFTVKVDTIDEFDPSDPALLPAADAISETDPIAPPPSEPVKTGKLVKKSPPVYPATAKLRGIQGVVIIDAIISTDGTVKNPHVISSPSPLLSDAGTESVSKWHYAPSLVNGVPVETGVIINVIFVLGGPSLRPPLFVR